MSKEVSVLQARYCRGDKGFAKLMRQTVPCDSSQAAAKNGAAIRAIKKRERNGEME